MKVLTLTDETGKVLYKTTVDNWRVDQVLDGEQLRITITGWTKEFSAPEGAFVKNYTKRKLPDTEPLLPVIVDASLAQQPELAEEVVVVSQWDSTNIGGTAGSDPEVRVARSTITNAAQMVTARSSKATRRIPAPTLDANAEAMLAAGWLS